MLVHICCSVDSHYFLTRLRDEYPDAPLTGYFYNPNIHPQEEHDLRLLDVQRSCERLGIPLLIGEYELDSWLEATKGQESEPEKGARCLTCFDERLTKSAKVAKERGFKRFTTTLLMSPKKSFDQLKLEAKKAESETGLEFVFADFRKKSGTQEQFKMAKDEKLYMQDYCGCLYALTRQREQSQKEITELYSDISNRILPNSLKEREKLYKKRLELEKSGQNYTIIKEKFLNYRLKRTVLKIDGEFVPSYTLFYSTTKKENSKSEILKIKEGLFYASNFEGFVVSINLFPKKYKSALELFKNPPTIDEELAFREKITDSRFSLSPILLVDSVKSGAYELLLQAVTFQDLREVLITLG